MNGGAVQTTTGLSADASSFTRSAASTTFVPHGSFEDEAPDSLPAHAAQSSIRSIAVSRHKTDCCPEQAPPGSFDMVMLRIIRRRGLCLLER